VDKGLNSVAPNNDFFGNPRPHNGANPVDIGAVETARPAAAASVSPSPLAFGTVTTGSTATQNLTVTNAGTGALAGGTFTGFSAPFSRVTTGTFPAGAPNCGATLAVGASCTIKVQFAPTAAGSFSGSITVAYTGATVSGSPVSVTGTGFSPGTLSFTAATNGTLGTVGTTRTLTFTIPSPRAPVTSVVTVTNTGAGPLSITAENLLINIGGLFSITANTCSFTTPLAPGGTCTISVRYATPATAGLTDVGLMTVTNNGTGTLGGVTGLALMAR
jgi:hypothetical protein